MSAEQTERRDNESAANAPCEIGAEDVRRDTLPVPGRLPNGIHDGVAHFGREFGVRQCASNVVGVEHRAMLPLVHAWPYGCPVRFVHGTSGRGSPDAGPATAGVRSPLEFVAND